MRWATDRERYEGPDPVGRSRPGVEQGPGAAARYGKTARDFLAFVHVAPIGVPLR